MQSWFLGAYRVRHFNGNGTLNELWKLKGFIALSIIQKLGNCQLSCECLMLLLTSRRGSDSVDCVLSPEYACFNKAGRLNILEQGCLDSPGQAGTYGLITGRCIDFC
jgi:hypothetical protein